MRHDPAPSAVTCRPFTQPVVFNSLRSVSPLIQRQEPAQVIFVPVMEVQTPPYYRAAWR
jgi:hypothetical protein